MAAYDVIVLGVGGMGSAAAYHLARRGQRVLALERFALLHEMGSSHGFTRIIRLAYFEHPSYVPLLRRAYELWESLERDSGEPLLHITGSVDAGLPDSRTFIGSLQTCEQHQLPHTVLTSAELSRRFPGYRLPAEYMALLQERGGFLVPERCISAHTALARKHGADVREHTRVLEWTPTTDGVTVRTDKGTFHAGRLVITAGSWSGALVPSLAPLLSPERQVLGWFDIEDRDDFAPARFPVFNLDHEGEHWYGFPEFGTPGFKLGCYHHFREVVDPDHLDRTRVTDRDLTLLREMARQCFPGAAGEPLLAKTCQFTNTPDEHFILDQLPDAPQVTVVSACSGHGFKFCSVVGEIAADLAIDSGTRHDIALHRLSRFATPS
ncbi:MAG: N-methyl-L-tryptophan oxidase [Gemmatimonadaceae bacterium]